MTSDEGNFRRILFSAGLNSSDKVVSDSVMETMSYLKVASNLNIFKIIAL